MLREGDMEFLDVRWVAPLMGDLRSNEVFVNRWLASFAEKKGRETTQILTSEAASFCFGMHQIGNSSPFYIIWRPPEVWGSI